jgi:hypothetical protein
LPGEVHAGGVRDELAERLVLDRGDHGLEVFGQGQRPRRGARAHPVGGAAEAVDRSDPKPQALDPDSALAEARRDLLAQERELARPNVGRDAHDEDVAVELHRPSAVGDADPDRLAPDALGHGWLRPGGAGAADAVDGDFEALRHEEPVASSM